MNMPITDRRRMRANQLSAAVMRIVGKYLCEHMEDDAHLEVNREIWTLFYESGAEIITDEQRAAAGLPPRGPEGWTDEELQALELKRLELMMRPITVPLNPDHWLPELIAEGRKP